MANLVGKDGRLFGEINPGADPTKFQIDNTSKAYFQSPYYLVHKRTLQPIPPPIKNPLYMNLADILDNPTIQAIQDSKQITFHTVGDTGAVGTTDLPDEESVADKMVADLQVGGPTTPSFFFHLGDVVYYFGESKYYYDQFYDPFRAYDRPIFAIPGNHDGVVYGDTSTTEATPTLEAFLRNFCAPNTNPSPDAAGLVRSVMTQPSVYFTLDAPMVSIIGLYSNVLEGPGVISSQGGKYSIGDEQLNFLQTELTRLKPLRDANERAIIIAVHHPPLSVDTKHGGTKGLSDDIDSCCTKAGLWPDAVLSGHAHLYERFTRTLPDREIPYVVAGSGGYNAKVPPNENITPGSQAGDVTLETAVVVYGYLTVTIDMTSPVKKMVISFHSQDGTNDDSVTVDLVQHKIINKS